MMSNDKPALNLSIDYGSHPAFRGLGIESPRFPASTQCFAEIDKALQDFENKANQSEADV